MSQNSVERLLGRLVTDARMRVDIVASPESVCRREGYDLTVGELRLVVKMNIDIFELVATGLDPMSLPSRNHNEMASLWH